MKIVLWVLQGLLAMQFLFHGYIMLMPPPELLAVMNAQMSPVLRIFIGVTESLGALGLILPGVTRIAPRLTVWASIGLMIVAGSAAGLHLYRGEISSATITFVLFLLLGFVAYMRANRVPLPSRRVMLQTN